MAFPESRPLRTRRTDALRRLSCETRLAPSDLIQPLLVTEGSRISEPTTVDAIAVVSADVAAELAQRAQDAGVGAVLLYGRPTRRDPTGSAAYQKKGVVPGAIAAIAQRCPDLVIICDLDLSSYTDHGHPGSVDAGRLDNDASIELAAKFASCLARAGATAVVTSGALDGVVGFVRETLDDDDFEDVLIIGEAAGYDSALTNALDQALDRQPIFGDRAAYRLDVRNSAEALREAAHDEEEGADMLLVSPAGPSLDVIRAIREQTELAVGAGQSLGELAMIEAAAASGFLDRQRAVVESLLTIKRAGADVIVTHLATETAGWLG